jgi:hypothetical protein
MSDDPRVGSRRIGTMVDAHIGSADPGRRHFHKNIVLVVNNRLLYINDFQLFGAGNLHSFHNIHSPFFL